ncbi:MAG: arginase family protein [Anaerolineae bacterium]|nr:arginase family protein [Anaerolineae bacterium]
MIMCLGVPYHLGERVSSLPLEQIQQSGFVQEIGAIWVEVQPDFSAYARPVDAVNAAIAAAIQQHPGHVPLVFSCDCTHSLGVVKGISHEIGIIWYDAHGDFNTPETSPSGYLGGMPLAILVGRGDVSYLQNLTPVAENAVILTDARNLDPQEEEALANSAIVHLKKVYDLLHTPLPDKPLYVHLDVDVLDASVFPATGFAEPNGPSLDSLLETLTFISQQREIAAALITLWKPQLTSDQAYHLNTVLSLARALVLEEKHG